MTAPTLSHTIPAFRPAIWQDGKLTNGGGLPLWSGKGPVPELGATVELAGPRKMTATILGYYVQAGWLMLWAERCDGARGDLAGAEIKN